MSIPKTRVHLGTNASRPLHENHSYLFALENLSRPYAGQCTHEFSKKKSQEYTEPVPYWNTVGNRILNINSQYHYIVFYIWWKTWNSIFKNKFRGRVTTPIPLCATVVELCFEFIWFSFGRLWVRKPSTINEQFVFIGCYDWKRKFRIIFPI